MKSNIDLTENRMFSRQKSLKSLFFKFNKKYSEFPWTSYLYSKENSKENEIILTGNKEERKFKEEYRKMNSIYYCDFCGEYIAKIPWLHNGLPLCLKCESDMKRSDKNRFPWNR